MQVAKWQEVIAISGGSGQHCWGIVNNSLCLNTLAEMPLSILPLYGIHLQSLQIVGGKIGIYIYGRPLEGVVCPVPHYTPLL